MKHVLRKLFQIYKIHCVSVNMGLSSVEIGCRICCDGEYGTVLFVGPIEGVEGTWLGVEWDNVSRGKHSGQYNNVKYFTTRLPNAGSFIKISKAEIGISLPKALKLKYGHENPHTPNIVNLPQTSGSDRHIEMIGMKKIMGKQSNFLRLTEVVLSGMLVCSSGEQHELNAMAPNIRELDLSQNLFYSWETVHEIVRQLPQLTDLILSKNRLQVPETPEIQDCYRSLKVLVLNDVSYSWKEIQSCAYMWPYIEVLSIQDNNISILDIPSNQSFSKLQMLSLDNNPIENWIEICKLGVLSSLKNLYLDNTGLKSIHFSQTSHLEKTELFPSLETLYLRNNKLKEWQDISELNKLCSLKNLMVNNNPFLMLESPETVRQFIIAKIQGLETLNRTSIEKSERKGAEFDYLKKFFKDWLLVKNSGEESQNNLSLPFFKLHPTYLSLLQKYGAPEETEIKAQSKLLKDNLVSVHLFSPLMPLKSPVIKKLPAEMTVGKLKALVKRLFKVTNLEIQLNLVYNEEETKKTHLDNNLRQLSFYSISDKDRISVEW